MSSFPATDRPRGSGGGGPFPPHSGPVEAGLFRRTQVGSLLRMRRIRCRLFRQLIGHMDPVEAGLFRRTQVVGNLLRMRRIRCRLFLKLIGHVDPVKAGLFRRTQVIYCACVGLYVVFSGRFFVPLFLVHAPCRVHCVIQT
jgi:hypothetical protein